MCKPHVIEVVEEAACGGLVGCCGRWRAAPGRPRVQPAWVSLVPAPVLHALSISVRHLAIRTCLRSFGRPPGVRFPLPAAAPAAGSPRRRRIAPPVSLSPSLARCDVRHSAAVRPPCTWQGRPAAASAAPLTRGRLHAPLLPFHQLFQFVPRSCQRRRPCGRCSATFRLHAAEYSRATGAPANARISEPASLHSLASPTSLG